MAKGEARGAAAAAAAAEDACRLATVRVLMPVGVALKSVSSPTAGSGSGKWQRGDKSLREPTYSLICCSFVGSALKALRLLDGSPMTLHDDAAATGSESALYAARAGLCG